MPSSLPQASGPFPGVFKSAASTVHYDQTDCCAQHSHVTSAAPDAAILAQHAFGGVQGDGAYASSHRPAQQQASDTEPSYRLPFNDQAHLGSMTGLRNSSVQVSSKALSGDYSINSGHCSAQGNENMFPGFNPEVPCLLTPNFNPNLPSHLPLSETTAVTNVKTENAYVSFDEWQAQVRAKQLMMQSRADPFASSVNGSQHRAPQHPLGLLSSNLGPGNANRLNGSD